MNTATATSVQTPRSTRNGPLLPLVAGLTALTAVGGFVLPDRTVGPGMSGSSMTHYMGLLGVNQPWNLLLFMAAPVVLAETLAITELALLFRPDGPSWIRSLSRAAGLIAGPLMVGIVIHLTRYAVIPLSQNGGWRGSADLIAVFAYLLAALPLIGITLVEVGLVGRDAASAQKWHTTFVAVFLVLAHVAMIFGMLDPSVLGWSDTQPGHGGHMDMPGM